MNIIALKSANWPDLSTKEQILDAITAACNDAERTLPCTSKFINIIVQPNKYGCIPETGCGGRTFDSELIRIVFDPTLPHGLDSLLVNLRATVFHEYNHVVRYAEIKIDRSFLNHAITEGLATVFERDYSRTVAPLWGKYEDDEIMRAWLNEVQKTTFTSDKFDEYTYNHPDGRRWIAYKMGAWLVDEAIKKSGKSVQELSILPYKKILILAGGDFE